MGDDYLEATAAAIVPVTLFGLSTHVHIFKFSIDMLFNTYAEVE